MTAEGERDHASEILFAIQESGLRMARRERVSWKAVKASKVERYWAYIREVRSPAAKHEKVNLHIWNTNEQN